MNETAGKVAGEHTVYRLNAPSIEIRGIYCRGIFLDPNNRAGRPQGILRIKITPMEQRNALPQFLCELAEDPSEAPEKFGRLLWFIHQIQDTFVVPTQNSMEIGDCCACW